MENQTDLRLPVIGKFHIESFDTILDGLNLDILPEDLTDLEKKIGNYLYISEEYKKILDLLFPRASDFQAEKIRSIVYKKCIEEAPLILKIFGIGPFSKNSDDTKHKRSAWANLMLDLGEFELDEHSERLKEEISREIKYTYSTPDSKGNNILNACFISSTHIVEEIWDRITKPDTLVVFIDDDEKLGKGVGLKDKDAIKIKEDADVTIKFYGNKIWLKPTNGFPEIKIQESIMKIIRCFEEKKKKDEINKLVFVVDLLYKMGDIDRIKGDELIRFLRYDSKTNPIIIGFTAGNSPFVINSAVRAGADIVIMKGKGKEYAVGSSHSSTFYSGGLFNLLWAISKNINRLRFLESHKKVVETDAGKQDFNYLPVLDKLFFDIDDESPFWRKYLTDWQRDIENLRLHAIIKSNSHE